MRNAHCRAIRCDRQSDSLRILFDRSSELRSAAVERFNRRKRRQRLALLVFVVVLAFVLAVLAKAVAHG